MWKVIVVLAGLLLLVPFVVLAQEPPADVTHLELRVYLSPGGVSPVTTYTFTPAAVTCSGVPWPPVDPSEPTYVNPSVLAFNQAELGDGCTHTMTTLPAWPIPGRFFVRLVAINDAEPSDPSPPSPDFFTLGPPSAPTEVHLNPSS